MDQTKSIMSWTIGIASVAFVLLLMAIIFGNLSGNTGIPKTSTSISTINETGAWVNETGYTLSNYNTSTSTFVVTAIWNVSASGNYNISIGTDNATISSVGVVTNTTDVYDGLENVSLSYTLSYTHDSQMELDAESIIGNYTEGAVNTSSQFPTVGTILGVALLILILLALLVYVITKMGGVSIKGNSKNEYRGGDFG